MVLARQAIEFKKPVGRPGPYRVLRSRATQTDLASSGRRETLEVSGRFVHVRCLRPPFGRRSSPASPFVSYRIERSRRNSICLFRERCSGCTSHPGEGALPHILSDNLQRSLALSGTITAMGKTRTSMARRSKRRLTKKTFVYFTKEEREIVDQLPARSAGVSAALLPTRRIGSEFQR